MKYLLDTCVLSELVKNDPDKKVVAWISEQSEHYLYLSVLTIGEIHKGIEKLPSGKIKARLHNWVTNELRERFDGRILDFDLRAASTWGELQAKSEILGRPMPAIDGQIAAIGVANQLTIVTRNVSDMEVSGVDLYNPWD